MFSFEQLGLENDSPVKKGPERARIIPKKTQTQKVEYELQQNQVAPGGEEGQDTNMKAFQEEFRNLMDDDYLQRQFERERSAKPLPTGQNGSARIFVSGSGQGTKN